MDDIYLKLLRATQDGIPLINEPFAEVAKKIGISEDEVIALLKKLKNNGTLKRFGASINHRKLRTVAKAAMVVWKVPQNLVETVGSLMSTFNEVTHCYNRQTIPGKWEYNLFTVIHGHDREAIKQFVEKLSETTGIKDYAVIFGVKEFKRASASRIPHL
ncbi:Lrp/AsnC family transcriptional regulator [Candidatus Bathyarchaeota archaeon]|nr:MAG: Lrp/AsnC family transcriptional regulator [Candidatus Bathyarchaeota archaeon]